MKILQSMIELGHEQVLFCNDEDANLKAIIAVHNTTLGPALGGCRMWPFKTEEEALKDVLRLARGMTYKNAAANLDLGGGKAVIIGDPNKDKSEAMFRSFGRFVQSLNGKYLTAEDVGMSVQDMEYIKKETNYVTGLPESMGGSGDPSPFTALGVFEGIKAAVKFKTGTTDIRGLTVAIQGVGNVGKYLCQLLYNAGAELIISDLYKEKVKQIKEQYNTKIIHQEEIYNVDADVLAPCALGAIINNNTINKLKFKIIAGGANNQLLDEKKHSRMLKEKGILYAPDYIINAGGVINISLEVKKEYNKEKAEQKVKQIYDTLMRVFKRSEKEDITTLDAASKIVKQRLGKK